MKNNFTDQQIDQMLRKLVNDSALDDATVDDIADSPQLWWGVQRKINTKERPVSIWRAAFWRRWVMFAAPLTVAALVLGSFFVFQPDRETGKQVFVIQPQTANTIVETSSESKSVDAPRVKSQVMTSAETSQKHTSLPRNAVIEKKNPGPKVPNVKGTAPKPVPGGEIKSEFIALSYARNPESGQIVRVKVPRSMMVSLGLVASIEKPGNLINAEILVGDDGMTHAIRFIR